MRLLPLLLAPVIVLAACSHVDVQPAPVNPTDRIKAGPGLFSGKSGNLLDAFKHNNGGLFGGHGGDVAELAVNPYLWRAALDSVSFMPLTQADSMGGVIVTDWYVTPANPNERVKLTIIMTGKGIATDSLKITMFKQQKVKGDWESVNVSLATTHELEDALLTKARALQVSDLDKKN